MTGQHIFVSADHLDEDLYANSWTGERALNAAIVQADIRESFEEYIDIFNTYYADDIEVSSDTGEESIRGKARVACRYQFERAPIPGDTAGETHSAWTLELIGVSGKTCALTWRTFRKWNGARVVYEHHYDQQQTGGPLTSDDLRLDVADPTDGFRGSSKTES